jgi:hypothetical protein
MSKKISLIAAGFIIILFLIPVSLSVQAQEKKVEWIRPAARTSPAVWGIKGGIVFSLWPYGVETNADAFGGGPRGLIRIGHEYNGTVHLINFLAIEPVVNGKIEFSEISPSRADQQWGKLMWAADTDVAKAFVPYAFARGVIDYPVANDRSVERLRLYVFMEQFGNGAHPYLRLSIRSDKPEEIGIEIFQQQGSAKMERCVVTATMGNYARLRNIYLKDEIIQSTALYAGYADINFVEKEPYPYTKFAKDSKGDFIIPATTNESFAALAGWPQEPAYLNRMSWRYRPAYMLTQYWRKEAAGFDTSLQLRVNGRYYYWSGGSTDRSKYIRIPGGAAFENFELRENFKPGQKFYFGVTRKTPAEILR